MSRSVPRLSLLARLGFGGVLGAAALVTALSIDFRSRHAAPGDPPASVLAAVASQPEAPVSSPARGIDVIGQLLTGKSAPPSAEVTGSLTPQAGPKVALGPVSGLPMPRFVSLKPDKVNVRQGPTRDQSVSFIFQRAGLPVEVVAEFENWRRIRDSEGAEGWVLQNFLSGRRTVLIAPWSKEPSLVLRGYADAAARPVARLQPGVLASIKSCEGSWCRIKGEGFDGWIEQNRLWGAYPGETVD